jgi:regulator of protease activity HflC (stomatin/prohibitin superfamily)
MKKLALVAVLAIMVLGSACTRINPGHVGVVVANAGDDKGVLNQPVVTGWQFYMPGRTNIYEFPTYVQTAVWTRTVGEGHPANEELQFTTKDGQPVTADVSFSYQLDPSKVPAFYVKFRIPGDALDSFTHGILRNIAREALSNEAANYTCEEIYFGSKKTELLAHIQKHITDATVSYGVNVVQLGFLNNVRPPDPWVTSIQSKLTALQDAQKVEAQKQIAQAEAEKSVTEARGRANAKIEDARGDSQAAQIRTSSITPQILEMKRLDIQMQTIEKWDGKLPETMVPGQAVPFVNVKPPNQ